MRYLMITTRAKGVLEMKKMYSAPVVEYLAFAINETIADEDSNLFNDGEFGTWS